MPVDTEGCVLWATVNDTFSYMNKMLGFGNYTNDYIRYTSNLIDPLVDRFYSEEIKTHEENLMGKIILDFPLEKNYFRFSFGSSSFTGLKSRKKSEKISHFNFPTVIFTPFVFFHFCRIFLQFLPNVCQTFQFLSFLITFPEIFKTFFFNPY